MNNKDISSLVVHKLATILDSSKHAEGKITKFNFESGMRPDLAGALFNMLNSVDDLLAFINEADNQYKYFGLLKEAIEDEQKIIKFKNIEKPDWDFTAWYYEKVLMKKKCIKYFIRYWEMDYKNIKLDQKVGMTPQEYVLDGMTTNLQYIQAYAQKVFDEVFNDKLEIEETQV
ncbi:MAG: hypothetical protein GX451_02420 [Acholeplasmataceae bacterium]|nr:hypothetical protein [Acholeplasmataceae bacterium]